MDDDWQESAFNNRHVHNRVSKQGRSSKKGGAFDARQALGSYQMECRSHAKAVESKIEPSLEIYGFVCDGQGLSGKLVLPDLLEASVLLSGSRKSLAKIIASLTREEESAEEEEEAEGTASDTEETPDQDGAEQKRIATFEKNSFRSPKFWMKWQGLVNKPKAGTGEPVLETNGGYIVFSPDVRKFSGTLSCEQLGWNNISISGRKLKGASERDVSLDWKAE